MEEIWKDIVGYEGRYKVSNMGRVKAMPNKNHPGEKILKLDKKENGYMQAHLYKDGKRKWLHVHRLVALAFIPRKEGCDIINHLDNIRDNNNVGNLEWTTYKGNIQHALKQGRMYCQKKRRESWR